MSDDTTLTQASPAELVKRDYGLDVGRVIAMRAAVEEVVTKVLREGEHFGTLPGMQERNGKPPKKMLFQPGAEVLCQVFRLRPEFEELAIIERDDFLSIKIKCKLFNSVSGERVGEAIGSANSREEKYLSQTTARVCPDCGKPAIIKGKAEFGGGWLCWARKDGCGAKFADDDKRLMQDQGGSINGAKVWGLYHTLESIAQKRSFVRATRTVTASSDIFTDEFEAPQERMEEQPRAAEQSRAPEPPAPAEAAHNRKVSPLVALVNLLEARKIQGKDAVLAWLTKNLGREVKATKELSAQEIAKLTTLANEPADTLSAEITPEEVAKMGTSGDNCTDEPGAREAEGDK